MKKVVVTGMGILSAIGNGRDKVKDSLLNGVSGIKFNQEYSDLGMRSHVSGSVNIDLAELIDRKLMRFMSKAAAFGYLTAKEALTHSGINLEELNPTRVGIVAGSGVHHQKLKLLLRMLQERRVQKELVRMRLPKPWEVLSPHAWELH